MEEHKMVKNLAELPYEELVQMVQDCIITRLQFVEANPDIYPDWEEWLKENNLERTVGAASLYMEQKEKQLEEHDRHF